MKFLIDFRDSENKEIAYSNLKKYGIEVEESKLENSTCIIETDLCKKELAKLIRIPLGKVITNSRTARGLVVLIPSENYIYISEMYHIYQRTKIPQKASIFCWTS